MTTAVECQNGTVGDVFCSAPWRGTPRDHTKDELAKTAISSREGASLPIIVEDVFGEVEPASADYQLARRFYNRHSDWFKTTKRDGLLWIEPTIKGCRQSSLDTASKQSVETQEGDGVALSNAEAMLRCRRTITDSVVRGDLLGAFAAKREATDDRFHLFEDTFNPDTYCTVPYWTRFNSPKRVTKRRNQYRSAWNQAAKKHDVGVVVTLTTDPSRYDNLEAATSTLLDDVNRLKDWLSRSPVSGPSRPGFRPPTIVVPEFTDDGKPHAHVVFFGVGWLTTHAALKNYWNHRRDRGKIVWLDRIHCRNGKWRWAGNSSNRRHSKIDGRSPRAYLEEGINLLAASADASAKEFHRAADRLRNRQRSDSGDDAVSASETRCERLWKVALYWATSLRVFTLSPSLRANGDEKTGSKDGPTRSLAPDGRELPVDAPSRWRYMGAAKYSEFPGSIRSRVNARSEAGVRMARPPPD